MEVVVGALVPLSAKKLIEQGIDPAQFPTCSKPEKGVNKGCQFWNKGCKLKERFETPGPFNRGVKMFKKTSSGRNIVIPRIVACHQIPGISQRLELNNGHLKVVAVEGESIEVMGTTIEDRNVVGEGLKRFYKAEMIPTKVLPYDETMKSEDLIQDAINAAAREELQDEIRTEREKEFLDVTDAPAGRGRPRKSAG